MKWPVGRPVGNKKLGEALTLLKKGERMHKISMLIIGSIRDAIEA